MAFDRFLIGPFESGLVTNAKPLFIAEDAFSILRNAYVFRSRLRKRFGAVLMGTGSNSATAGLLSRFRINIGTTDGAGAFAATVPGLKFKVGQQFSIGTEIFTVQALGTPVVMLTTGASTTHTYNTTTGAVVFAGSAVATIVYFYPGEPVMGLDNYENAPINNQPSYGFDTQFAYIFSNGWSRSGTGVSPIWHGTNSQFFWVANWRGVTAAAANVTMFVTNFNATVPVPNAAIDDPIWYTSNGSTWTSLPGVAVDGIYFLPSPGTPPTPIPRYTGPYVKTAKIIVPFKDRLVLLNTIENNNPNGDGTLGTNTAYPNRARYSHNGDPFAQNAWYEPNTSDSSGTANNLSNADGGGFIDAPTEEQIVGAEFLKDRLIVEFERSTWELAYTGNQVLPFVWQQINTELGSESTFSTVPFDKAVLAVGNVGVHACNGSNVERIDQKIPQEVFQIRNGTQTVNRVHGVRDYFVEMVYWTYPSATQPSTYTYPDRLLVYNYQNQSWSINDDCITAFGYFEQQTDTTWSSTTLTWEEFTATWNSGIIAAQARQVIAGNQQGYTFIIRADTSRNAPVMQVSNVTITSPTTLTLIIVDHTLEDGAFLALENMNGLIITNNNPTIPVVVNVMNVKVDIINSTSSILVSIPPGYTVTGSYLGGGTATRVSNYEIFSKQWNPYLDKDRNVYLQRIDFGVEATDVGEVTVDYSPSSALISMIGQGGSAPGTNSIMGTNILETRPYPINLAPLEQVQERLWHPIYFQSDGSCIQIIIYMSDTQMFNNAIAWEDFEIDAMILYCSPTSSRMF